MMKKAMIDGFGADSQFKKTMPVHPLETSERSFEARAQQIEYALLRKSQGLHAPLKLQMEKQILSGTGHLPFLPRHNASLNFLTGDDELIGPKDYLGHPHEAERMGDPHGIVERKMKIL